MKRKGILIVSAEYVSNEMKSVFGNIPPVIIPYIGKTILEHVYEHNHENYEIQVLLSEGKDEVLNLISELELNVKATIVDDSSNIAETISAAKIDSYDELIIIFGDTILENYKLDAYSGDKIAYSISADIEKWQGFRIENGNIKLINSSDSYENNVFCGIFSFSKPKQFISEITTEGNFYNALIKYNQVQKMDVVNEQSWLDFGHIEEYTKNVMTEVETRFFNQITIDPKKGTLKKSSDDTVKLIKEIEWYLKIPKELDYIAPRIFDYSLSYSSPYVEMEYYAYPTLHNAYIYSNYSLAKWSDIFDVLLRVNKMFRKYKLEIENEKLNQTLHTLYVKKTIERLNQLKSDPMFKSYFNDKIKINGKLYSSLNEILLTLEKNVETYLFNITELNVIHGDYFFANILFDTKYNFIRVIDPRGDFGGHGIFGDYRYDLAKLSHSVNGKYDYIIEDRFKLEYTESEIKFKILAKNTVEDIKDVFESKIDSKLLGEIKLIESLLFLSMVPLHADFKERQLVMLATGIENYNKAIKELEQNG